MSMVKATDRPPSGVHPENNYGFDTSKMMTMINMAKEGLQDQLRKNDSVREEERDLAAENAE